MMVVLSSLRLILLISLHCPSFDAYHVPRFSRQVGPGAHRTNHATRSALLRVNLSPSDMEQETSATATTTTKTSVNITPSKLRGLNNCASSTQARRLLEKEILSNSSNNVGISLSSPPLYKSISIPPGASTRAISDGDLAIQTRLVNKKYNIMELIELSGDRDADRASLAVVCLTVGSTLSALVANQKLPGPEILRFLVVWLFSFAPLFFVGYGIADAEKLQGVLVSVQRNLFPVYRQRMIQHEAGHFLMGHLLGWPIAGYQANAVKNAVDFYPLSDMDAGRDFARQLGFDKPSPGDSKRSQDRPVPSNDAPFFSEQGRGREIVEQLSVFREAKNYTDNPMSKLPAQNEPSLAWPYRGFDEAALDQLTVISVAGVCAEILAFGNAEGGVADLSQLRQIFNSAETKMTDREVDNRIRFALGYTMSQLRRHLGALDALAAAMERGDSVAECVVAIEACENVSGQDGIMGDYERRRRESFLAESWFERSILGGDRSIDTEQSGMVEGPGGGYKKETFRLTGDDPLYAALAVAIVFLTWASAGGLSLH